MEINIKNSKSIYENKKQKDYERSSADVAIIGIACRFPGAQDYEEFFQNLEKGVNSVKILPDERWDAIKHSSYSSEREINDKKISKHCGILDDIDKFDNEFFNISPREAINMDPQQRILLEEAWHCIEDSGVALSTLQQKTTSVYIGVTGNDYSLFALTEGDNIDKYASMGNFECILSNRISYVLGLNGTSLSIDAACASSLVTICEAKNSLLSGESDYSIAGGVCLAYHPWRYLSFSKSYMMSLDGQCKAFAKDADGFVQGEGVGVLLLQRLEDAIRDGNNIYGIIKGSAVNHGGNNHTMTAPKVSSQKEVITSALENANISPETISYIETHGTGTVLGDPIEIEALSQSYRQYTKKKQFCKVGSVKSNIGHLASAAGVASVIKVLLMMKHRKMVKSLHVDKENPIINFQDSPFKISKDNEEWTSKGKGHPLRAGVSSFGFGGVNCHIIIEEFHKHTDKKDNNKGNIFALSAKNQYSLKESLRTWDKLASSSYYKTLNLEDLCTTLLTGREQYDYRFASMVYSKKQLKEKINEAIENETFTSKIENKWCMQLGSLRQINKKLLKYLKKSNVFKEKLHDILNQVKHENGINKSVEDYYKGLWTEANELIYSFATSYAYASTLVELGLEPSFVTGEDIGKWTGYAICGMLDIKDVLDLILDKSSIVDVKLNEPIYPYYDETTNELFMPSQFNKEYLELLITELSFANFTYNNNENKSSTLNYYMNKYESLKDNQFSFRRDIENWNEELKQFGYDIFEMLSDPKYRLSDDEFETEKIIILMVIMSALYKISKKWSLTETRFFENKYFYETVDLIIDGILPEKEAVQLFFSNKTDLYRIAEKLNQLKVKLKSKNKYKCLSELYQGSLNQSCNEMSLTKELREEVLEQLHENISYIQIGEVSKTIKNNDTCIKTTFKENNDLIFLQPLMKLWKYGVNINWNKEYSEGSFSKMVLPVYPFKKEAFWIQTPEHKQIYNTSLHPMIDTNISDFEGQRFIKTLKGDEFFISEHIVDQRKIMPAAAYLEIARTAGELSFKNDVVKLSKIIIGTPLIYDNNDLDMYVNLFSDNDAVSFEINSLVDGEREKVHSQGLIIYDSINRKNTVREVIDIESIKSRCDNYISAEECYDHFEQLGIEYGESFRCLKGLFEGKTEVISIVELEKKAQESFKEFTLHPSIIDGAFQSVIRLAGNKDVNSNIVYLPFSIEEVEINGKLQTKCYVYARIVEEDRENLKESNRIDIDICDESGNVIISIKNFRARAYNRVSDIQTVQNKDLLYYKDEFITEDIDNLDEKNYRFANTLIFSNNEKGFKHISDKYKSAECEEKLFYANLGTNFTVFGENKYEINENDKDGYSDIINQIYKTTGELKNIIYFDDANDIQEEKLGNDYLTKHIHSLLSLCQALIKHKIRDKIKILYIYKTTEDELQPHKAAISSFGRTINSENPNISIKSIGISDALLNNECSSLLSDIALYEINNFTDKAFETYYNEKDGIKRSTKVFEEFNINNVENAKPNLRENGTYLITGGLGGLGLIFAEYLARNHKARLVLIGRSELNSSKREKIHQIELLRSEVFYIKADITSQDEANKVVNEAKIKFGCINGVLHCAGILKDAFFINKTHSEMAEVLSPKIHGVVSIDEATKNEDLDFFVMFSSIASILGSVGQCDYSYANGFMDAFVRTRKMKNHSGKTIAINWPLWADGGMQIEDKYKEDLEINQGIYCIENHEGLQAFEKALSLDVNQLVVLKGQKTKIEKRLDVVNMEQEVKQNNTDNKEKTYYIDDKARAKAEELLKGILSEELRMSVDKIDSNQSFDKYGIDSVMILDINKIIEKTFSETSKTLLFEYQNVASLAEYFLEKYPHRFTDETQEMDNVQERVVNEQIGNDIEISSIKNKRYYMQEREDTQNTKKDNLLDDIAIIGISGRYPEAENLDELWENLIHAKDCITEIPADRWKNDKYFDADKGNKAKYYSKWGGFIKDVDKFDTLFFNITPREAELIDPQERIFLESVWQTIEDAGYTRNSLKGSNIGVFTGVMYGNYSLIALEETLKNNPTSVGLSNASIANRVSYFFDFNGPSITLDTMCSSSLTTIHLACESIKRGECDFAIAGGVNLTLHPNKYIFLSQGKFMSTDGRCRSFGDGGDGYVPGEGVGTIMLKPLQKAIEDKDIIYGVIKASSVNHGGKTNGFTVPNPVAQAELISNNFKKAGIRPETIGYIEAHGTGTSLGDPIEITGLTKVFEEYTSEKQICAIGSIKSNIGHLESAAGIAAITKVLLQLKHKLLVPSIHSEISNPNIEFENTPFYVQRELSEWKQQTIMENGKKVTYPRRASVSAFGAGGANGHLIIEEYIPSEYISRKIDNPTNIFILSAKTEEALKLRAKRLIEYLNDSTKQDMGKEDIQYMLQCMAYTLQIGREAMEERLAIIASTKEELISKLNDYIEGNEDISEVYIGGEDANLKALLSLSYSEDREYINSLMANGKLEKIARIWVGGMDIDWSILNQGIKLPKLSLPTYEFTKQRYWIHQSSDEITTLGDKRAGQVLHPLIDFNVSTIFEQCYKKSINKNEYIVKDHLVSNRNIIAGAVQVEMARIAGALATDKDVFALSNIMLVEPIIVEDECEEIFVGVFPNNDKMDYEIYSKKDSHKKIYSRGKIESIELEEQLISKSINLQDIKDRCQQYKAKDKVYETFKEGGLEYGDGFTAIEEVNFNEYEAFSYIKLPKSLQEDYHEYVLHPSILDAAFGTIMSIGEHSRGIGEGVRVPFSIDRIEIRGKIPQQCYAHAILINESRDIKKYNVIIMDETGNVLVYINNFTSRIIENKEKLQVEENIAYFETIYKKTPIEKTNRINNDDIIMVFENKDEYIEKLVDISYKSIKVRAGEEFRILKDDIFEINPENEEHYFRLFEILSKEEKMPRYILHALNLFNQNDYYKSDKYGGDNLKLQLDKGVFSILGIFKAITQLGLQQSTRLLYLYNGLEEGVNPWNSMNNGFANSITTLNYRFELLTIQVDEKEDRERLSQIILEELTNESNISRNNIRYVDGERYVMTIEQLEKDTIVNTEDILIKNGGIYLITGGLGEIGRTFAEHLANNYKAKIILTGRSTLEDDAINWIRQLEDVGSQVTYLKGDISEYEDVKNIVEKAKSIYGTINGVLHCAGIATNTLALNVDKEEFEKALAAKVYGTVNIDTVLRETDIDFLVLFSSISSIMGDFGVCSYAVANSFMDAYAEYRHILEKKGLRKGKTLSIDWPLWQDGGMDIPENERSLYFDYSGFSELKKEQGIKAFEDVIRSEKNQIIVSVGNTERIKKTLKVSVEEVVSVSPVPVSQFNDVVEASLGENTLHEKMEQHLKEILSTIIKLPSHQINASKDLEEYGIDSIMIMEFNEQLEKDFEDIPSTLLFEYKNLYDLAGYFIKNYSNVSGGILKIEVDKKQSNRNENEAYEHQVRTNERTTFKKTRFSNNNIRNQGNNKTQRNIDEDDQIAIIGISGKYPMAENLEHLWQNITNSKDSITEVPLERWDYRKYYDPVKGKKGKIYSKWGGFLDNIEMFDPLFFNISPKEAELMDPQERLFLQTAWSSIEDAGYKKSDLSGKKVGVFVGAMYGHYQIISSELSPNERSGVASSFFSSIANRVSYFMNFTGPSLAVDTACSSSLEAIRLAYSSIKDGSCEMAIAGGVNLTLHPEKYLFLCESNFLSTDGRCRSFGKGGDGYVPGEGVGAVILKPLKKAIEDKDNIYAVIKSAVVNHNGKTNGYSVPNPNAQSELIQKAIEEANIEPQSIGYIEAHGTGTALGDPIEIAGLVNSFSKYQMSAQSCPMGSIKSNIGHLESAAGIAALTKVILQMKNKMLVPSIHVQELNEKIDFEKTPFYVQREVEEWKPFIKTIDGRQVEYPRRAGINAFGAGGTNVHMILEEYKSELETTEENNDPHIIVLSAKNKENLKKYALELNTFINKSCVSLKDISKDISYNVNFVLMKLNEILSGYLADMLQIDVEKIKDEDQLQELYMDTVQLTQLVSIINNNFNINVTTLDIRQCHLVKDVGKYILKNYKKEVLKNIGIDEKPRDSMSKSKEIRLKDIAFTLQNGREPMEERLAMIVESSQELCDKLDAYIAGAEEQDKFFANNIKTVNIQQELLDGGMGWDEFIYSIISTRDLNRLAYLWSIGFDIEWGKLNTTNDVRRISLPTYPFLEEYCWITDEKNTDEIVKNDVDKSSYSDLEDDNEEDMAMLEILEMLQRGEVDIDDVDKLLEVDIDESETTKY